jgi:hypothetical protein
LKDGSADGKEAVVLGFPLLKFARVFLQMEAETLGLMICSVVMRTQDAFGRIHFVRVLGRGRWHSNRVLVEMWTCTYQMLFLNLLQEIVCSCFQEGLGPWAEVGFRGVHSH